MKFPIALILCVFSLTVFAQDDIPVVPVSVVSAADKAHADDTAPKSKPQQGQQSAGRKSKPMGGVNQYLQNAQLTMEPGVNEIIAIAKNHLNRIVTPFESPVIKTSNKAITEINGNVVYLATKGTAPVTVFITEKGDQDVALSLTLIPKEIPPREIHLELAVSDTVRVNSKDAKKWETSQPYVKSLQAALRKIALGEIPKGYSMKRAGLDHRRKLPKCKQRGFKFSFQDGQAVKGHYLTLYIGTAKNVSDKTLEFMEEACGEWTVAAVASYPLSVLKPGQSTEVYVAKKISKQRRSITKRPSLLELNP